MSEAKKIIWLQRPNSDPENIWAGEDITWCEDKIGDDDTCYIKAGVKTVELANEISRLRAENARLTSELGKYQAAANPSERLVLKLRAEIASAQAVTGNMMAEYATMRDERDALRQDSKRVANLLCEWKTGKITGDQLADKLFSVFASTPASGGNRAAALANAGY